MFAIIRIGAAQHIVRAGEAIEVDRVPGEVGAHMTISDVLLTSDGTGTNVGTPTVKGASVEANIEAQYKGDKIDIRRFKAKVRERRHVGFRPLRTRLLITAIHA